MSTGGWWFTYSSRYFWGGNLWVVVIVKSCVNEQAEQPIRSQVSKLAQLLKMTTTHKFPLKDFGLSGGTKSAPSTPLVRSPVKEVIPELEETAAASDADSESEFGFSGSRWSNA